MPLDERALVAGHSLGAMSIAAWAGRHDVERRVVAAPLLNTGVGDLIAEQLLFPLPQIAQVLNQTLATRGFLGNRAPLPRFSTPLSSAVIRYVAFGPDASPAQVAFYERMLVTSAAGRARRDRDRDVRHGSPARAAASDGPDDRDRRRRGPAHPALARAADR